MSASDTLICPGGTAIGSFDYCAIITGHPARTLVGKPHTLKVINKFCSYFFPGGTTVDGHNGIFTFGGDVPIGGIGKMYGCIIITRTSHCDFSPGSSSIVCADQVSVVGTDKAGGFIYEKHIVEIFGRNCESNYMPGISSVGGFNKSSVRSAGKSERGIHKMDCRQ